MLEFIAGYLIGSRNSSKVSGRQLGIFFLVWITLTGFLWLLVAELQPDSKLIGCGGPALSAALCTLDAHARMIGIFLLVTVAVVVAIWATIAIFCKK